MKKAAFDSLSQLASAQLLLIDGICDQFVAQWQSDQQPRIEHFLSRAPADIQRALLRELLSLEVEIRTARGDRPQPQEYQDRFADHADIVADVLASVSLAHMSTGPKSDADKGSTLSGGAHRFPQLEDYRIESEIGRGAMGVVFKAWQISLNRVVAIKMLHGAHDQADHARKRFRFEALAAAQLRHPNIVAVHDFAWQEDRPYYVTEFTPLGSLAKFIRDRLAEGKGPLSPREAAALVEILARAIHHAHQLGIVHRDLKPGNVLLFPGSTPGDPPIPKVADFGLAKNFTSELSRDGLETRTGDLVGTPAYMAPEQAECKAQGIGPATDVYALGAILHELLSGKPPFHGHSVVETLRRIVHEDPQSLRRALPGMPRDLETICFKCLAKDPAQRYATALDLADDLRRYLTAEPIRARPPGRLVLLFRSVRRRPVIAGLAASLLFALVGLSYLGTVYLDSRSEREQTQARFTEWEKSARQDRDKLEHERARVEAEARQVQVEKYARGIPEALQSLGARNTSAVHAMLMEFLPAPNQPDDLRGFEWYYLLDQCRRQGMPLQGSRSNPDPQLSREGRWAASFKDGEICLWDAWLGVPQRSFADLPAGTRFALSPAADRLVVLRNDGRMLIKELGEPSEPKSLSWRFNPLRPFAFSPSGSRLVGYTQASDVCVADLNSGRCDTFKSPSALGVESTLTFSASEKLLASSSLREIDVHDLDKRTKVFEGWGAPEMATAFHGDGKELIIASAEAPVAVLDTRTWKPLRSYPPPRSKAGEVALSPGGRYLASARSKEDRTGQVAVYDLQGVDPLPARPAPVSTGLWQAFTLGGNLDRTGTTLISDSENPPACFAATNELRETGSGQVSSSSEMDHTIKRFPIVGAQLFNPTWNLSIRGGVDSQLAGLAYAQSRFVYTAGTFKGRLECAAPHGNLFLESGPGYALYVLKMEQGSDQVWHRVFPCSKKCRATQIASDAAGNVLIAGTFRGTLDLGSASGQRLESTGNFDQAFLLMLDSAGKVRRVRVLGDSTQISVVLAADLSASKKGEFLLAGTYRGSLKLDAVVLPEVSRPTLFLAHLSATGTILSATSFPDLAGFVPRQIAGLKDGSCYVAGLTEGSTAPVPNPSASRDRTCFLARINPQGRRAWSRTWKLGLVSSEEIGLAAGPDDGAYLAGQFAGSLQGQLGNKETTLQSIGVADAFLLRIDPTGHCLAARSMGGSGTAAGTSVVSRTGDFVAMTGWFDGTIDLDPGPDQLLRTSRGGRDGFVLVLTRPEGPGSAPNITAPRLLTPLAALDKPGEIGSMAFSQNEDVLTFGVTPQYVWHFRDPGEAVSLPPHQAEAWAVAFSPDGRTLLTGGDDWQGRLMDVPSRLERTKLQGHASLVTRVAFTPAGNLAATASFDGTVKLWDAKTGKLVRTLEAGRNQKLRWLDISPDGALVAAGPLEHELRIWDTATGAVRQSLRLPQLQFSDFAFVDSARILVSGASVHGQLELWDVNSAKVVRNFSGSADIGKMVLSPDRQTVAVETKQNVIELWNIESGARIRQFRGHQDSVYALAFHPDGKTLVSAGQDNTMRFWQISTGHLLMALRTNWVHGLAFSPDGSLLASAHHDGSVKLWRGPRTPEPTPRVTR